MGKICIGYLKLELITLNRGIKMKKVSVIMGSISDKEIADSVVFMLEKFGVAYEVKVISAHRTPYKAIEYVENAEKNGIGIVVAIAGKAAHLAGVLAGVTTLPVIGVPVKSSTMDGLDSLLSVVQMPTGVPVATVAINGGKNAGILASQILALSNPELKEKLISYKNELVKDVENMNQELDY